ncbi:MAG: SUMF1/EgtB/PvdO family nonheme iron enzyme [Anaerolineae bacterium]|nr:SUMF1/EgtB/PvdO family nonheme iron enzyme [Anaerolineae bacterium]
MTPPKLKQLFISYRSSDAAKVDKIARDLALLKYDDGTPRYGTWQDKHNLPPASPNWWDAIVDAIIDCDMFVMNISRASLQSEVCRAELDYAHKRNRPIIPVILDGEFFLDPKSGKYDLPKETWALVPDWLGESQFLFYAGTEFYGRFQQAVEGFERHWPRDISAPRPLNPDSRSVHGSNHALYDAACDYAERLAFADAEKHFDALVRRNDEDYGDWAAQWLELIRRYAELVEISERRIPTPIFNKRWASYTALYPKEFLDGIFDPKRFATHGAKPASPPVVTAVPVVTTPATPSPSALPAQRSGAGVRANPRSVDLLPAPFAWIEIPKKGYSIAKYPVTNAQFAKFIEAGGYREKQWWTEAGWKQRSNDKWTEPRFWNDSKWNGEEQPVVGVSWYEAVAFCLWLSEVTGEKIMLPTEDQGQYAAQGDDGRDYPWGKQWDASRCNNNVDGKGIGKTTPVQQYEGKGDSPFGVVDMAGNVWEWCLTDYDNKTNDINSNATLRVLRGGSWNDLSSVIFRCDLRLRNFPLLRNLNLGFRLAHS